MTGHEDSERLSAYLDAALAPDERREVEAHLQSCPECRRELASLGQTVALLKRVQPVRAPGGFVERVVSAAQPRPWYRRALDALLLPLTVKVPLQATAALMIGLLAVYLFERTPELQRSAREQAPETRSADRQAPVSSPPEPAMAPVEKARPAPAAPGRERERSEIASREAGTRQEASGLRDQAPPAASPPAAAPSVAPSAPSASPPVGAPPPAPAAPAPPRELGSADARAEVKKETSDPVAGVAPPAPERRTLERTPHTGRPAASPRIAAKQSAPADVVTRVAVKDRDAAERELTALIARVGGSVAHRQGEADATMVEALVPQPRYAEFVEGLGRIGAWQVEAERPDLPARIRVILRLQ